MSNLPAREAPHAIPGVPDALEIPTRCPRCGADFVGECQLREVDLVVVCDDEEWTERGVACRRCGWCTCDVGRAVGPLH